MGHVETDAGPRRRNRREQQIAGPAREIEHAIGLAKIGELDDLPLPPPVLTVRQKAGDEIVAVGDGREQAPDVATLALGRRNVGPKGHCARRSRTGILTTCRTLFTVVPRSRSLKKRCPCVDIAMRSTLRSSARRMSSVAGSPIASSVDDLQRGSGQLRRDASEIRAVGLHLLRFAQLELIEIAGRPAVGDVDEQQLGSGQRGQLAHVREDRAIGRRILDGDENRSIHD